MIGDLYLLLIFTASLLIPMLHQIRKIVGGLVLRAIFLGRIVLLNWKYISLYYPTILQKLTLFRLTCSMARTGFCVVSAQLLAYAHKQETFCIYYIYTYFCMYSSKWAYYLCTWYWLRAYVNLLRAHVKKKSHFLTLSSLQLLSKVMPFLIVHKIVAYVLHKIVDNNRLSWTAVA